MASAVVDLHHHDPLEVRHCAGYGVYAVIVSERTAVAAGRGWKAQPADLRDPLRLRGPCLT